MNSRIPTTEKEKPGSSEIFDSLKTMVPIEIFLKRFIERHPEYRSHVLGRSKSYEAEYNDLMRIMRREWLQTFPSEPFFLEETAFMLDEDFMIPDTENAVFLRNLRYMPLLQHTHQFIELDYVLSAGDSEILYGNESYKLYDGDILLCPPGFTHCFKANNEDSVILDIFMRISTFDTAFFNLLNTNSYLSSLFANALYSSTEGFIIWHCPYDEQLSTLFLTAFEEWGRKSLYHERMLEIQIMEFFLLLMRKHENGAVFSSPFINQPNKQFHTLLTYMMTHYQNVTLSLLAAQFNYSERQVLRLLKKNSGKSFSELLLDIRMNKAMQFLKNPRLSIADISRMLGYSNKNYFIKVFTAKISLTPDAFRKQLEE